MGVDGLLLLPQPSEDEDGARQKEDRLLLLDAEWKTSVLGGLFPCDPPLGWESCPSCRHQPLLACPVSGQMGHERLWQSLVSSGQKDGR